LQRVFDHARSISPILDNDRFTVPEYQELLQFISSGELWDMTLEEMPQKYFELDVPSVYKQSINTQPF
jgi:hypothetical protein